MKRRRILKQGGAALSVITTAGLAGCSSDDGGDDGEGGDSESSDDTGEMDNTDDGTESTDGDSNDGTESEDENTDDETTQVENGPREGVDGAQVSGEFDASVEVYAEDADPPDPAGKAGDAVPFRPAVFLE